MERGDLFLVTRRRTQNPGEDPGQNPGNDPRKQRVFVVVSRQVLIDSGFSSVVCAPVYSRYDGLRTQVIVGADEGLKHSSSIHCDELATLPKAMLTRFVGHLKTEKLEELDLALAAALDLDCISQAPGAWLQ